MTIEEIQALLDGITAPALAEGRDLTEQEVTDYTALEADLKVEQEKRKVSDEIKERHEQYKKQVTQPLFVDRKPERDTIEAAFNHYLRTGKENADLQELRAAQSEGTGSQGGFTVPEGFRQKIVDRMKAFGGIATVAEEIVTATGNPLPWPTVDDTSNTGEVVAENGTFAAGADLVFGEVSLGAYKYMAGGAGSTPLRVSVELLADSAFDIERLVGNKLGERIARIQASHLVSGTGSGQPQGITDGLTGIEIAADTAGITYADLLHFVHSVDPAYRQGGNCKWAFNDFMLETIQGIVDDNGRPIIKNANDGANSDAGGQTILGYPVVIDQSFPNMTAASNTINWGVFGDLTEGYVIRRVKDVTLIVNPWTRAANGQVEYTAWARMDAVQQNPNAYVALTGEA